MNKIDFTGGWTTLWNGITSSIGPQFATLLNVVGVAIVVMAIFKWAWDRKRSGGGMGNTSNVWGALLVGCMLAAPGLIVPIFLTILDAIASAAVGIWNNTK